MIDQHIFWLSPLMAMKYSLIVGQSNLGDSIWSPWHTVANCQPDPFVVIGQ